MIIVCGEYSLQGQIGKVVLRFKSGREVGVVASFDAGNAENGTSLSNALWKSGYGISIPTFDHDKRFVIISTGGLYKGATPCIYNGEYNDNALLESANSFLESLSGKAPGLNFENLVLYHMDNTR